MMFSTKFPKIETDIATFSVISSQKLSPSGEATHTGTDIFRLNDFHNRLTSKIYVNQYFIVSSLAVWSLGTF